MVLKYPLDLGNADTQGYRLGVQRDMFPIMLPQVILGPLGQNRTQIRAAGGDRPLGKATVVLSGGVLTVYPNEGGAINPNLAEEFQGDNNIGGNISSLGGYYNELKYFVEGLQGKNDLSVATVAEAVASVKLVKKEIEAAGGLIVK